MTNLQKMNAVKKVMREVIVNTMDTFTHAELKEAFKTGLLERLDKVYNNCTRGGRGLGYSVTERERLEKLIKPLVNSGVLAKEKVSGKWTYTVAKKKLLASTLVELASRTKELENN